MQEGAGNGGVAGSTNLDNAHSSPGDRGCRWLQLIGLERKYFKNCMWSSAEWIKKMWPIYTMEYYSAIKRNEIELFVLRWMNLESVIQSEVSQKEKSKYCMLTHIYEI